jgi:hypothetical protein
VIVCKACGRESPEGAAFCASCGAPLSQPAGVLLEERKVVTILFADLVGSTAQAERRDPEDVRATLNSYYARLRTELERHGGTVEKFIGDAVMAVFGAPVAHEDDPERAVRAALAIRDALVETEVDVRIAVHTGEALVSRGARAAAGEAMVAGRRRQHGCSPADGRAGERRARRRDDVPRDCAHDRLPVSGRRAGEGQSRSRFRRGRQSRPRRASAWMSSRSR